MHRPEGVLLLPWGHIILPLAEESTPKGSSIPMSVRTSVVFLHRTRRMEDVSGRE